MSDATAVSVYHDEESQRLLRIDHAKRALAEAKTIPDVKHIRDMARAMEVYTKQQQYSLEIQNEATELKLRAERKAGQLLQAMDRTRRGGDPPTKPAKVELHDLGVTKHQSSTWQKLAQMPEETFEAALTETKAIQERLTSTALYTLAQEQAPARPPPDPDRPLAPPLPTPEEAQARARQEGRVFLDNTGHWQSGLSKEETAEGLAYYQLLKALETLAQPPGPATALAHYTPIYWRANVLRWLPPIVSYVQAYYQELSSTTEGASYAQDDGPQSPYPDSGTLPESPR